MNKIKNLFIKYGFVLCGVIIGTLTGCETYDEHPRAHHGAYPPPPVVEHTYVEIHSENDFYEPLSPYGQWVTVESYGRCWKPARVDRHWRPYSNGHWVLTDAGWYWESDEPWGWATYHYGRWDWSEEFGWVWVPQTQWAPAWVSWRRGEGYVGWAPLPPSARFSRRGFVEVHDANFTPKTFVFVEERRFLEPVRPATVIVNNTIINKTVNITNVKIVNNIVINEGPRIEVIEKVSGRKVKPVSFHELRKQEVEVFKKRHHGKGPLPVYKQDEPYKKEGVPGYGPKVPGPKQEVYEIQGSKPGWSVEEKHKPKHKGYKAEPEQGVPAHHEEIQVPVHSEGKPHGEKGPGQWNKSTHQEIAQPPVYEIKPYKKKGPPAYHEAGKDSENMYQPKGPAHGPEMHPSKKKAYEVDKPKPGPAIQAPTEQHFEQHSGKPGKGAKGSEKSQWKSEQHDEEGESANGSGETSKGKKGHKKGKE